MNKQQDLHMNLENMSNSGKGTSFCQCWVLFSSKIVHPIAEKTEAYLELNRTSTMLFFCDKPLTIFGKKAPLQMFDWVLNTPLKKQQLSKVRFVY